VFPLVQELALALLYQFLNWNVVIGERGKFKLIPNYVWGVLVGRSGDVYTLAVHILYAIQQGSDINSELLCCYRPNAF
jgi:hypothetical protein